MKINVSNGEIVDKLTILEIKSLKIQDEDKQKNIQQELTAIRQIAQSILKSCYPQYQELRKINETLWDIEDRLRLLEKKKSFGPEFIELARNVYKNNDQRARLKKAINLASGSEFMEEKSYTEYS